MWSILHEYMVVHADFLEEAWQHTTTVSITCQRVGSKEWIALWPDMLPRLSALMEPDANVDLSIVWLRMVVVMEFIN